MDETRIEDKATSHLTAPRLLEGSGLRHTAFPITVEQRQSNDFPTQRGEHRRRNAGGDPLRF